MACLFDRLKETLLAHGCIQFSQVMGIEYIEPIDLQDDRCYEYKEGKYENRIFALVESEVWKFYNEERRCGRDAFDLVQTIHRDLIKGDGWFWRGDLLSWFDFPGFFPHLLSFVRHRPSGELCLVTHYNTGDTPRHITGINLKQLIIQDRQSSTRYMLLEDIEPVRNRSSVWFPVDNRWSPTGLGVEYTTPFDFVYSAELSWLELEILEHFFEDNPETASERFAHSFVKAFDDLYRFLIGYQEYFSSSIVVAIPFIIWITKEENRLSQFRDSIRDHVKDFCESSISRKQQTA